MAPDNEQRVANAVNSLIGHLVPVDPSESQESAQQRHDDCFELVHSILNSPASTTIASDVNHASDLIKRKLIQSDPGQALRFSNLYSRLLSLPVLGQKWAILYLLYQLGDSADPNEPRPVSARSIPPPLHPEVHVLQHPSNSSFGSDSLAASQQLPRSRDPSRLDQERFKASTPLSRAEEHDDGFGQGGSKRPFQRDAAKRAEDERSEAASTAPAPSAILGASMTLEKPRSKGERDVSIKSALLADNYAEINPPESSLLRDLPFTLQGLSSTTLPFAKPDVIKLPTTLPSPIVSLLHTLAEPSLLYRNLETFVKSPTQGLLGQSLRAAIGQELRSYLTLVATLETQIRKALSSLDDSAPRGGGIGRAGITLKRCVVWTRDATMGLRLMSLISEESETKRGGELISLIHGFSSSHGDPIVAAFAERLLGSFTRPFYSMLRHWIYDGELSDPYLEFFVREQTSADEMEDRKPVGGSSVWEDKYKIDEAMIPSIMTQDFAQKVFLIGKSLNFIRHSCGDSQWVDNYSKDASKELRYGDTATLEAWIDEAHKTTMKRLVDLMATKFHMFEHLQALKKYILLGQGDFIALLMESLAANLDRPAGAQYRHTLTAQLDHAIRGSNAQYDSAEVLRRLDARMLQLSHGDIGWDCFTLEYKIDAPVDVVVTDWGNRQYLKVFNFLWRIKRVEFALNSTWRKCMTGARGVLQTSDPAVTAAWKATRGVLAEMIHFVGQLQYYILFEVIESSWNELQERIHRENCTLDDIIKAHMRYLNDITHKGLLGPRRARPGATGPNAPDVPSGEDDRTSYLAQLGDLLRAMLNYRDCVDGLYSWSVSDFTRRQEADVRHSTMLGVGLDGRDGADSSSFDGGTTVTSEFPVLVDRLRQLGTSFRTRLQILLGDLAYQPDVDMRFLGVAMNFNDVYQPARRKTKAQPSISLAAGANASMATGR